MTGAPLPPHVLAHEPLLCPGHALTSAAVLPARARLIRSYAAAAALCYYVASPARLLLLATTVLMLHPTTASACCTLYYFF